MSKTTVEVIETPVQISVDNSNVSLNVVETPVVIEVGTSGPQGPMGEIQPEALGYVHNQAMPSSTWTINHGLMFIPNITVVDSAGSVVEGSYNYPDNNTVIATFSSPFSGKAYLS